MLLAATVAWALGFSQGAQDALTLRLFEQIGHGDKQYVEFGFDSNEHCRKGAGSNTCVLKAKYNWTGLLMDGHFTNPNINLHREFIHPSNIAKLLTSYNVPLQVDYLSADLDSFDLWVVRAILEAGFRPRLFSVEYNSHFPFTMAVTVPNPETMRTTLTRWSENGKTCAYGASARAYALLFAEHGYAPVGIFPGLDLFFMPTDLAKAHSIPILDLGVSLVEVHFHHPLLHSQATQLIDYVVWRNINASGALAAEAQHQGQQSAMALMEAWDSSQLTCAAAVEARMHIGVCQVYPTRRRVCFEKQHTG